MCSSDLSGLVLSCALVFQHINLLLTCNLTRARGCALIGRNDYIIVGQLFESMIIRLRARLRMTQ